MNSKVEILDCYNENIYLNILKFLFDELNQVEAFLNSIVKNQEFNKIDELEKLYENIFSNDLLVNHISYKVSKIVHSLSLWRNEENLDRSNSYYHLTLTLKSETIVELDKIYSSVLLKILRFYIFDELCII